LIKDCRGWAITPRVVKLHLATECCVHRFGSDVLVVVLGLFQRRHFHNDGGVSKLAAAGLSTLAPWQSRRQHLILLDIGTRDRGRTMPYRPATKRARCRAVLYRASRHELHSNTAYEYGPCALHRRLCQPCLAASLLLKARTDSDVAFGDRANLQGRSTRRLDLSHARRFMIPRHHPRFNHSYRRCCSFAPLAASSHPFPDRFGLLISLLAAFMRIGECGCGCCFPVLADHIRVGRLGHSLRRVCIAFWPFPEFVVALRLCRLY